MQRLRTPFITLCASGLLGLAAAPPATAAESQSPWRVWSLDVVGAPPGALRWLPTVAAEPREAPRAGERLRLRPGLSLSRGGAVVLSFIPRPANGLLLTLQLTL